MSIINKIKQYLLNDKISPKKVDVIDGIRVLAIGMIAWFHIWQQSWLSPHIYLNGRYISFIALPRAGYLWVDMFILLSAFQLFLPHARQMISGDSVIGTKEFYSRRTKRILPSYLLSIFICLYFALFRGEFTSFGQMLKDLLTHLTFTQTFFAETYLWTKLNVVLWTVAILVQFYILFPLIAKAYKRFPYSTFLTMCAMGITFRIMFVNSAEDPSMYVNQLPAFFDVLILGIVGAHFYTALNKIKYQKWSPVFTAFSIASLVFIYRAMKSLASISEIPAIQNWQGINRSWVAIAFLVLILSTAYSMKWYRKIFSNKITIFLSSISFNFYIWHQYIAVKLKQWNFPYSEYAYPNMSGDEKWQYLYTFACFAIAILFAWLVTWLYEGKLIPTLLRITKGTDKSVPLNNNNHKQKQTRRRN